MPEVRMYCTESCPFCQRAETLLIRRGAALEKLRIDETPALFEQMKALTGRQSVPQIFIGSRHVGGYDELVELDMDGDLLPLLNGDVAQG